MNATAASQLSSSVRPHLHVHTDHCPTCEQPIPNEKAAEIRARAEARSREMSETITARLNEEFSQRKSEVESNAAARIAKAEQDKTAALEEAQRETTAKEAAARAEGERRAEERANTRLAAAEASSQTAITALQEKLTESEHNKTATLEKLTAMETAHAEEVARRVQETENAAEQKLQAALTAQSQSADSTIADLRENLDSARRAKEETAGQLATLTADHEKALETRAAEVQAVADRTLAEKLAEKDRSATDAISTLKDQLAEAGRQTQEANARTEALKASQVTEVEARVQEVRTAMEADKVQAVSEEKAKHFNETQKLTTKLEEVTRQLEKKTAAELGEGAEVKLFEELRGAFKNDRFTRVDKGTPGADIIHEVVHKGRVCGKIVYDSKNRNAWRNDYVTKLRDDQGAAQADYAVLAALKFPADQSQIHIIDEVIIANPARVLALVELLRQSIIGMHNLRSSNSERTKKSAAVFEFIRSERFRQLFGKFEKHSESLLKLQEKEKKEHDKHWQEEGKLLRNIQKAQSELTSELDAAMGLSSDAE